MTGVGRYGGFGNRKKWNAVVRSVQAIDNVEALLAASENDDL
jgi:hypothetical protein